MNHTLATWTPMGMTVIPSVANWYVVVCISGYATISYWDGDEFDRTDILFWSPIPTS